MGCRLFVLPDIRLVTWELLVCVGFDMLRFATHDDSFALIISCAKTAHDQHSSLTECASTFFSFALITS